VSTEDQVEKYGLDAQLHALHAHAKKAGLTVAEEFIEKGVSGATLERPALTRLRELARLRTIDCVLIYSPDRLARDLMLALLLERELKKAGVAVEYCTVTNDDTPTGELVRNMLGVVAQFERGVIHDRTSRGRQVKARNGRIPGGSRPFGFKGDPTSPSGWAVDDEAARTVRHIFALLNDGTAVRRIVDRLNTTGMRGPEGGHWAKTTVLRILTNESYAGRAFYNRCSRKGFHPTDQWIAISVPAIVSGATFQRAQEQLARNRRQLAGRRGNRLYVLKGLLVCACGRKLYGTPSGGRPVYRCAGRDRLSPNTEERCRIPTRMAVHLEEAVWMAVANLLRNPTTLLVRVKAEKGALDSRRVAARSDADTLRRDLDKVDRQLARLVDLYVGGGTSKAMYDEKKRILDSQREELAQQLHAAEALTASGDAEEHQRRDAVAYCKLIARGIDRLDQEGRQRLLRKLVTRVVVEQRKLKIHGLLGQATPEPDCENPDGGNWSGSRASRTAVHRLNAARMLLA
jgi:site-specific DNA recombinase